MITKWKAFNFKSIRKETELDFAPLTIFAGANSSGKSTFLQPILLVAQTLAHKVTSRSVVLNGAFARLGQFDDLRSVDSDASQIVIGWTVEPLPHFPGRRTPGVRGIPGYYGHSRPALSSVSCQIAFDTEDSGEQKEITQIHPRLHSSHLSTLTSDPEEGDHRSLITIRRATAASYGTKQKWIDSSDSDEFWSRPTLQYDVELDENSLDDIREEFVSAEPAGCLLRHFLPERLSLGVDRVAEDAQTILNAITGESPRGFYPSRYYRDGEIAVPPIIIDSILKLAGGVSDEAQEMLSERLLPAPNSLESDLLSLEQLTEALVTMSPRFRREIRQRLAEDKVLKHLVNNTIREERKEEPAVMLVSPPPAITEASWYLENFFSTSVRYLGPLRDEPKSLYPLSPTTDPSDVGLKGEHTAAVLELHKNRTVEYIPTSAFSDAEIKSQSVRRSLAVAVADWLQYLGVAEGVRSEDKGKSGHELTVQITGINRSHDLTHVGVGVSQVLPILVASLLSDPDTTLIFEQPELHLHPKVQTLLADFFLSITQLGKQCILETHSEYLINRIRFRIAAAAKKNPWVEVVRMYFVERASEVSTFREVKINEYGAVMDWPEGFFDQSQEESEKILIAAAKKRRAQRES